MSHFTHIKTCFQNLAYLEKALSRLNIEYQQAPEEIVNSTNYNVTLVIPQKNNYPIKFIWNSEEYELVADLSFWEQVSPMESFLDKIAQQYASEVIMGESQKMGFQPIHYCQNNDGSNTLILERWTKS